MSSLLNRMKAIMENEGIKPKQLTEELGISNSSFTDWGKGKGTPSVVVLSKFATYFNVSLDYLVFGDIPSKDSLEFSNTADRELVVKFHSLPPECQQKLLGYVDGMLAVSKHTPTEDELLSV